MCIIMNIKVSLFITASLLLLIITGCASQNVVNSEGDDPIERQDQVTEQINDMTLAEKIGQLMIVGIEGLEVTDHEKRLIDDYHVGGFIALGRNVKTTEQLLKLTNDLKSLNEKNDVPLFLAIDEEGGSISRMPEEFVDLPTNREIGRQNNPELSLDIGKTLAKQIKAFGYNINFAPVLDIDSNPNNPVIGDRSFGSDVQTVSNLGIQTMKGLQSEGILSVVKHFPGHGDTSVDSHLGLPVVNKDKDSLMAFELVPFIEAIKAGVDGIMVAHILYEQIDPDLPATLSKKMINDILRKELGYEGLVFTDDLTMGAILENYDLTEAAILSLRAGTDVIVLAHGFENIVNVLEGIKEAVETGEISEERINESVYRVLKYKKEYEMKDDILGNVEVENINEALRRVLETFQ